MRCEAGVARTEDAVLCVDLLGGARDHGLCSEVNKETLGGFMWWWVV